MSKIIVFDYFGTPAYTTEENYDAQIMNAFKVNRCPEFKSLNELKERLETLGYDYEVEVRNI